MRCPPDVREASVSRPPSVREASAEKSVGIRNRDPVRTEPRQRCGHGQKTDQVRRGPEGADPTEDVGPLRLVAIQASRGGSAHEQAHARLDRDRDRGGSRRGGRRERAASITGRSAEDVVAGRSRREAGRGRTLSKARRSESPQPLASTDRWAARGGPCDASGPRRQSGSQSRRTIHRSPQRRPLPQSKAHQRPPPQSG